MIGCNETTTTRYANFQEAIEDDLFIRGWLPDVLPVTTREIIETHNIDFNARCAEAVIPVDSMSQITFRLSAIGFYEFKSELPRLPKFGILSEGCTFALDDIGTNSEIQIKPNEIAVLDLDAGKFYYWSF